MKLSETSGHMLFGVGWVVGLVLLVMAAGPSFDDKSKSQQDEKKYERLIYSLKGPDLFRAHCAPCHGSDGKGAGPVAPALNSRLPDLTTLEHRNAGIFPEARIRATITGDETIVAHGSREMPVWGPIFHQIEEDRDYGDVRLRNIVAHLRSIQQK